MTVAVAQLLLLETVTFCGALTAQVWEKDSCSKFIRDNAVYRICVMRTLPLLIKIPTVHGQGHTIHYFLEPNSIYMYCYNSMGAS